MIDPRFPLHYVHSILLPEAGAGVDDPVTNGFLSNSFLHQSFLGAEQLHGQLVVCGSEDILKLVSHPAWLGFT